MTTGGQERGSEGGREVHVHDYRRTGEREGGREGGR